jgi:hypothetical protein
MKGVLFLSSYFTRRDAGDHAFDGRERGLPGPSISLSCEEIDPISSVEQEERTTPQALSRSTVL